MRHFIATVITNIYIQLATEYALIAASLFFICGFSLRQSLGASFFVTLAIWWRWIRSSSSMRCFTPYKIYCSPNVYLMLSDIGLVRSPEEFWSFFESHNAPTPWDSNHVVRYGIYAVFLSDFHEEGGNVVHFPWEDHYTANFRSEYRLSALKLTDGIKPEVAGFMPNWSPDIFVQAGVYGYEFGVRVYKNWWEQKMEKNAVIIREDNESHFGTVRLVLCILPYQATTDFYSSYDRMQTRQQYEAHRATTEKKVGDKGWKMDKKGNGEEYEHRYARVWIMSI